MSKFVLNTTDLAESFFEDTRLIGIMSPLKDYQLCWHLNSLLGVDFRMNADIEIQLQKKQRNYFFSVYEFCEPAGSLAHYVYNNRFDGEYLLPEFKHLDFLWLMKGDVVSDENIRQTIDHLRSLNEVQLVVELTNEKIKNKEHLVF
jgi:hypothetical protein